MEYSLGVCMYVYIYLFIYLFMHIAGMHIAKWVIDGQIDG